MVMLVLSTLSVAVLARSLVSLNQVRRGQDFVAALATADGGLSDALFRIDQAASTNISGAGSVGGGAFQYVATRQSDDRYVVKVKGVINGSAHAVEATVSRRQKFPYALFSNQGLTLNGNGGLNIYSYSTSGGPHTGKAHLGSNRSIVVNSGSGAGDYQDYYSPAGSCIGCPNPLAQEGPYVLDPIVVPTIGVQTCPPLGAFTTVINGMSGVPVVCDHDVSFVGNVTVINPPAIVYVTADHRLTMADSTVNQGGRGNDLQIYKAGSGALDFGNGSHATTTTAVLYAPASELTLNGGATWFGSITVNSVKVNGAPNFTLGYDQNLSAELVRNWTVSHWHEVPSSSVGF
ncbi:MAG: hypothetical protein QOK43_2616 [Acidimicrobiaceae bacterium]|nr:hypothetical protein [Acidimicrobiaceae bacterium]MDQ1444875.1 hypothetical protein [Acidimicrobiaceae bacterium]